MPADKTLVTDAKKLLRLTHSYFRAHGASATARKAVSFLSTRAGHDRPEAEALLSAESVLRRSCPELTPLGVFTIPRTRPRLNLLLDDLSVRRLYGGNGTAVLLGLLFAERQGFDLRLITRRRRADPQGFAHLTQLLGITLPGQIEFKHVDCAGPVVDVDMGTRELFLTTSCATTLATLRTTAPDQIVFLVQDDERLRHPCGDQRLRCEAAQPFPFETISR